MTDPSVDVFDREKIFIETVLQPLIQRLPQLKVVMEHITTMDAVKFVESCKEGSVTILSLIPFLMDFVNVPGSYNFAGSRVCGCNSHTTTSPSQQERSFSRWITTAQLLSSSSQKRNTPYVLHFHLKH